MPCRPKMEGCRVDCLHRALVEEYRETKAAAAEHRKLQREYDTVGHATEGGQWDDQHPDWWFRDFLISRRREWRTAA